MHALPEAMSMTASTETVLDTARSAAAMAIVPAATA